WIGFVLVVLAFVSAFHDVRVERDTLVERINPKLELSDSGNAACYQVRRNVHAYQLRRVIVTNVGATNLEGVRVRLVNLRPDPTGLTQKMPLPLKPQHMKDAGPEDAFSLVPHECRPVDVFSLREEAPGKFV